MAKRKPNWDRVAFSNNKARDAGEWMSAVGLAMAGIGFGISLFSTSPWLTKEQILEEVAKLKATEETET